MVKQDKYIQGKFIKKQINMCLTSTTVINRMGFLVLTFIILSAHSQNVLGQSEKRLIREGNRLYQKEQFDESELSYRRALEKDDDSPRARFNLGNALFKQERYDEAMRYFGELADEVEDPANLSKIYHNLGNSMLRMQQIEQSIEAYKKALRNNPGDAETRYNLAYAQHLLDEMEDEQQDQNEDGDGDDDENNQDNEAGQDDDQQQQEGDDNDREDGNDQQPDDQQDKNQQDENHQSNDQPRPDQMTPEEALRMLQAAEREEQRVQEKLMENKSSNEQSRSGRNW